MKFSGRVKEIDLLEKQFKNTSKNGQMKVITGRRRIGKTMLSHEYAQNHKYLYLFISRKSEKLLCDEFISEIVNSTNKCNSFLILCLTYCYLQ